MFVGTGAKDKDIDFNNSKHSKLHYQTENGLVAMMADFSRVRIGDYVIFYLQAKGKNEGKFYGIYQIKSEPFHEVKGSYLHKEIGKQLTFRALIKPFKVFAEGITEWEALDEIKNLQSPNQMLWSLIYRKLKGNRGNTMITLHEANRLFYLLTQKNKNRAICGNSFSYNNGKQISLNTPIYSYDGNINTLFNIQPRLLYKKQKRKAYEAQLQMYIMHNIGRNLSLDAALNVNPDNLEWLGNEVSCGVGMQRIDIMYSQNKDTITKEIVPIELKAVPASEDNVKQISRYIDWIEQYYTPNTPSIIRPILICPASNLNQKTKDSFSSFNANSNGRYLPLEYIEFSDNGNELTFTKVTY